MKIHHLIAAVLTAVFMLSTFSCKKGSASARFRKNNTSTVDGVLNAMIAEENSKKDNDSQEDIPSEILDMDLDLEAEKDSDLIADSYDDMNLDDPFASDRSAQKTVKSSKEVKEKWSAAAANDNRKVDKDLTVMGANMVYAEVYNMMIYPEDYLGKIIKVKGLFASYHDELSGNTYYACIIQDALACCSNGLEFSPRDKSLKYPVDFPVEGEEVTIVGKFSTYTDDDIQYLSLADAVLM
ncbi:hypothetical protein [Treponema sp.]|uniref:hypothetical protein n=1 Tax=Treponema sp. TaxID=166 RepID=UPI0025F4B231|nr:hypothetical protein [Treponema sp.]MCR5217953.1 hypothetical protein [Treponema sp.]